MTITPPTVHFYLIKLLYSAVVIRDICFLLTIVFPLSLQLPHSIAGEELAFVFGAPLASAGLFHGTQYTAQEKLLTEAVMSYWCNFAKTG